MHDAGPFAPDGLCCPAHQHYYGPSDSLSAPTHFPATSPVIGPAAPATIRSSRAEEGLPSSRRHLLAVPRPLRRRVPRRCAPGSSRLPWPSPIGTGLGSLFLRSRRGRLRFMLRTGKSHDPKGRLSSRFDADLSTDAGDQLPGSLATTRTGLTPASDDGLTARPAASPPPSRPTGHTPDARGTSVTAPRSFRRRSRRQYGFSPRPTSGSSVASVPSARSPTNRRSPPGSAE